MIEKLTAFVEESVTYRKYKAETERRKSLIEEIFLLIKD